MESRTRCTGPVVQFENERNFQSSSPSSAVSEPPRSGMILTVNEVSTLSATAITLSDEKIEYHVTSAPLCNGLVPEVGVEVCTHAQCRRPCYVATPILPARGGRGGFQSRELSSPDTVIGETFHLSVFLYLLIPL
jgi:hypothetical protein